MANVAVKALCVTTQVPGIGGKRGIPTLLWGGPGIGKSSAVEDLLSIITGKRPETVITSIQDPTDFGGLPMPTDNAHFRKAAPEWAHRLSQEAAGLFLDEISQAPPANQSAVMRVVLNRVVGDLPLDPGTVVVAAANPPDVAAGGWELAPPLANRFCHVEWQPPSVESWAKGMLTGDWGTGTFPRLTKEAWEPAFAKALGQVTGWLRRFGDGKLYHLPEHDSQRGGAWPSPRSWENAIRGLAGVWALYQQDEELEHVVVGGCVGVGLASEALTYLHNADLPDPEELLEQPSRFHVDRARPDRTYIVLASLQAAALREHPKQKERVYAALQVVDICCKERQMDVAMECAGNLAQFCGQHGLIRECPKVFETYKQFTELLTATGHMAKAG